VKVIKPQITTRKEENIAQQLMEYLVCNVLWEKDINRGKLDRISFSIRYVGRN
jgi:hypothetical protein